MRKRKLLFKCGLSPGDIVMLTTAVRDLHRWYPDRFITDVRTSSPDIWANNPYLSPLSENDSEVEQIDCSYPLINRCNYTPYHCLHGFIEFLNERLRLSIKPTAFKGDIHLASLEKKWLSQVHEQTREETPFWIIAAGGKYDVTIKWWQSARYQEVVNHFRGRIQFVQVGEFGHHHLRLDGVIDLRGKTDLRQLIRLVYHAQGVLCSVTALMHLAAAVETKKGQPPNRPCVVVAGGREPPYWEAYPDHQFIHTNGALPCCANGGCWKDRIAPLRDGDKRDRPGHLCVDVVNGLPHCMDMISSAEVTRRIELYFQGGALKFLTPAQQVAAQRGVCATSDNPYDKQPLSRHNAGMACDQFIRSMPVCTEYFEGRGVVICGGGVGYFTNAWVCINMLRRTGCNLPVEFWYLNENEMDEEMRRLLAPLGVKCVDAGKVRKKWPVRRLKGWELKPYAILRSAFREVLLLDADNVPVTNPEYLFETAEYGKTGAIFWPDYGSGIAQKGRPIWKSCGLRVPREPEFESGQIVLDKSRCWKALRLCQWFNENSDFYYHYIYGDKETFHLAFRKLKQPYSLIPTPIHSLEKTMCQHDFAGKRLFQHRNEDKWDFFPGNRRIKDFWLEKECFHHLARLRELWSGRAAAFPTARKRASRGGAHNLKFEAIILSQAGENESRPRTSVNLAGTDWTELPVYIQAAEGGQNNSVEAQTRRAYLGLKESLKRDADYTLLLEDAMDFNRHIHHNLQQWGPLKSGNVTLAGLYNTKLRDLACDLKGNARLIDPASIFGVQAFFISRRTVEYLVRNWHRAAGPHTARISRLTAGKRHPIFYHSPSLVQPLRGASLEKDGPPPAKDFDRDWIA